MRNFGLKIGVPLNSRQGFFNSPIIPVQSQPQLYLSHFKNVSPLCYRMSFSIVSYLCSIASVPRLFFSCRPSKIILAIVSIIIDSFNCGIKFPKFIQMFLVGLADVILKFLKRFPFAFYTTTTVSWVSSIYRIITNRLNSVPHYIKRFFRKSVGRLNHFCSTTTGTGYLFWLPRFIKFLPANFTYFYHSRILSNNLIFIK